MVSDKAITSLIQELAKERLSRRADARRNEREVLEFVKLIERFVPQLVERFMSPIPIIHHIVEADTMKCEQCGFSMPKVVPASTPM